jgi:hypothetical protein
MGPRRFATSVILETISENFQAIDELALNISTLSGSMPVCDSIAFT